MNFLKRLNSRGDTIVEVMIVLTVLALALSISYATASRSLINARQAQENTEATVIAQSQIEQLRNNFKKPSTDTQHYIYRTGDFCFGSDGTIKTAVTDCTQRGLYKVTISTSDNITFDVKVLWDDLSGNGTASVTMSYRLHKP